MLRVGCSPRSESRGGGGGYDRFRGPPRGRSRSRSAPRGDARGDGRPPREWERYDEQAPPPKERKATQSVEPMDSYKVFMMRQDENGTPETYQQRCVWLVAAVNTVGVSG